MGTRKLTQDRDHQGDSAAASTVASVSGDVSIQAGKSYTQVGSAVQTPSGNIDIQAQSVAITEARQKASDTDKTAFTQSGLTLALSVPGLDGAMNAASAARQAAQAQDPRMQALAAATAAMKAVEAAKDLAKLAKDVAENSDNKGISLSLTVGGAKATSQQTRQSEQGAASNLSAGGNISIAAKGAGSDSNLLIRGTEVSGREVQLSADNHLSLQASANSSSQRSENQSVSGGVGLAASLGKENKFGVTANASLARGNSDGSEQSYADTQIKASGQVRLQSGGDTTLQGAVVQGQQVKADVGGDLKIQSLQDSAQFGSKDQSLSGSVTVFPGSVSASLSASQTQVKADFLSVGEQSGIKAGDGGFQISVKGKTDLQGGVISSSQAAIDHNTLNTGSLTASDLQNHSQYKAESLSLTVGTSGGSAGAFKSSGKDASTTRAGISQGQVTIAHGDTSALGQVDRSVTTQSTNSGVKQNWDGQQLQTQTALNAQIVQQFGSAASKQIGDGFKAKTDELKAQAAAEADPIKQRALTDEAKKWDEGGSYRVAAHAAIGGLTGNVAGAAGAALSAKAAPALNELQTTLQGQLTAAGLSPDAAKSIAQLTTGAVAATAGAATGGTAGAAAGFNQDLNNRQLHASEAQKLAALKIGKTAAQQDRLDSAACALVRCADGVPDSDPNKAKLVAMQTAGAGYGSELAVLKATQEFVYQPVLDPTRDAITRNGQITQRAGGAVNMLAGTVGMVSGGVLAAGGAVTCVPSAGSGCGVAVLGTGLAVLSYPQIGEGQTALFGAYQSKEGQRVLDSFKPQTYPGERDPLKELGIDAAKLGVTSLLAKYIPKGLAAAEGLGVEKAVVKGGVPVAGKPDTVQPEADFANKPSGLNETTPVKDKFGKAPNDSDLATHLSTGGPSSKNVYGAHAEAAYQVELKSIGATEVGKPVEIAPGVWEHQYNTPARMAAGKDPITKTTYDSKWTDQQMLDMSKQASSQVWTEIQRTGVIPPKSVDVQINGVPFKVLVGRDVNGNVTSIYSHPGRS